MRQVVLFLQEVYKFRRSYPYSLHLLSPSPLTPPLILILPVRVPVPVSIDEEDSDKEEQEEGFIAPETVEAPVKGRR
jgi:hypothetical protein